MASITIDPTDIDSLAAAVKAGLTTPVLLSDWLDSIDVANEIVEDCLVVDVDEWHAVDVWSNAEIVEEDHDSGEEAAQAYVDQEYVDNGDWGDDSETHYVDVNVWRMGVDKDGDIVPVDEESHTITVTPSVPDCEDDCEHDWQSPYEIVGGIKENPGVWGKGGGVVIHEVCMHCGCERTTDTWAQNPCNGVQGLTSVSYEPGKYADEVRAMAESDE